MRRRSPAQLQPLSVPSLQPILSLGIVSAMRPSNSSAYNKPRINAQRRRFAAAVFFLRDNIQK